MKRHKIALLSMSILCGHQSYAQTSETTLSTDTLFAYEEMLIFSKCQKNKGLAYRSMQHRQSGIDFRYALEDVTSFALDADEFYILSQIVADAYENDILDSPEEQDAAMKNFAETEDFHCLDWYTKDFEDLKKHPEGIEFLRTKWDALLENRENKSEKSLTDDDICRAAIATVFVKPVGIVAPGPQIDDYVSVGYVRPQDDTLWAYACKIEDDRVIWATVKNGEIGRWRDLPEDGNVNFMIDDTSITVTEIFYGEILAENTYLLTDF